MYNPSLLRPATHHSHQELQVMPLLLRLPLRTRPTTATAAPTNPFAAPRDSDAAAVTQTVRHPSPWAIQIVRYLDPSPEHGLSLLADKLCPWQPDLRTISVDEIVETAKDCLFPFPPVGPGYYILRCGTGRSTHYFGHDPLNLGLKHFKARVPHKRCHIGPRYDGFDKEKMVRKHGYRGERNNRPATVTRMLSLRHLHSLALVVDSDDEDIDADRARNVNEYLTSKAKEKKDKAKEDMANKKKNMANKKKDQADEKQKTTKPQMPPIEMGPCRRAPPSHVYPSETAQPAQTNPTSLVDGPRAPVPDMNFGFTSTYLAPTEDAHSANRHGDDADSIMVCCKLFPISLPTPSTLVPHTQSLGIPFPTMSATNSYHAPTAMSHPHALHTITPTPARPRSQPCPPSLLCTTANIAPLLFC